MTVGELIEALQGLPFMRQKPAHWQQSFTHFDTRRQIRNTHLDSCHTHPLAHPY